MSIGPFCNFCGKNRQQVKKLLAGNENTHICDNCVDLCYDIVNKERDDFGNTKIHKMDIPSPRELHDYLNKHVIGQEGAKKTLSVAVYNHYKRVKHSTKKRVQKSNVLLAGPTGTGKTLMAQTLAEFLEVPFVITDATVITESGYAGEDAEVLVHKLFQAADYDVERAQIGIIYVDEIDKKARRNNMASLSRDVSGEGVQQSLLKLMEGTVVSVPNKPGHNPEKVEVDTQNILFIVGGAFVGLDDIVKQRIGKNRIGFNEATRNKMDQDWQIHLQTRDLVKYGLIPEFVGRLPSINMLQELDKDDLVKILTEPENSIVSQLKFLFSLDKVEIEFNNKALDKVADIALEQGLGARGLRKILDQALLETQYSLPELAAQGVSKIIITDAVIADNARPLMVKG